MRSDLLVPGLFAALAAAFPTPAGEAQNATCHDIQILIAVGHGENYPGTQQSIAQKICSGRSSCATSNIAYPSTASGSYCSAIQQGIASGQSLLKSIAASCPQTKIVILGWSQGAQVAGDLIAGGGGKAQGPVAGGCTQATSTAIDPTTSPGNQIAAIALFGDPRHNANQAFNVGTGSNKDGAWPRTGDTLKAIQAWSSKLRDYCAADDIACNNGKSTSAHGSYFGSYAATPAAFVNSML